MSKLYLRTTFFAVSALMLPLTGCVEPGDQDASDIEEAEGGDGAVVSTDVILDAEGREVGYLDAELNERDLDGNLVTGAVNALTDDFLAHRITVWQNSNFTGYNWGYHNSATSLIVDFATGTDSPLNNKGTSLAIAAGCKATLYDGNLTTVLQIFNIAQANVPTYVPLLGSTVNDRVSSIKVECKNTTNTFCGYAYRDVNFLGERLPIFHHSLIRLTDSKFSGWNDTISSVSANSNSVCDGIGLWADSVGTGMNIGQSRRHLSRSGDDSDIHDNFLGNAVTTIETDREVSSGELTHNVMGRVLAEVAEQRGWGKTFVCNLVDDICVSHGAVIAGLTFLAGKAICAAIVGTAVVEALGEAGAEIASDGTATPVVAPLAGFTAWQISKGVACWAAVGGTAISASAACDATMDTFCANNVNP